MNRFARTALPVVRVKVSCENGKEVDTYALLDAGSTNTFCSESLREDLGLDGEDIRLSHTTLEKTQFLQL